MTRSSRRRRGGFTLVEVLLVLAILTVIASVVTYNYGRIRANAFRDAARTQIKVFDGPLEMYRLQVGDFPSTSQGLEALRTAPSDLANPEDWAGPYLKSAVPQDPWKRDYQYEYPGKYDPTVPDIWSLGPDGADGTEDDVVSWQQE